MAQAPKRNGGTNAGRGDNAGGTGGANLLWIFLFYTLAGPFIAGLLAAAATMFAGPLGWTHLTGPDAPTAGQVGITAYMWSAIPAALTALMLLPFARRRGGFGWPLAGMAGVVAFGFAYVLSPVPLGDSLPYASFAAGVVSIIVRQVLIAGNVIRND